MSTFDLTIDLQGGDGQPFQDREVQVSVKDGNQKILLRAHRAREATILIKLGLANSFLIDQFTLTASAKNHYDEGFIGMKPTDAKSRRLLLSHRDANIVFKDYDEWHESLRNKVNADDFAGFARCNPKEAACLLNILEAMRPLEDLFNLLPEKIPMRVGERIRRPDGEGMNQDRLLLLVTPAMKHALDEREEQKSFERVSASQHGPLKPGDEAFSYKQKDYAAANLQFTLFHNRDKETWFADIDMDYFKSPMAHVFGEVLPNKVSGSKTEPARIFAKRWNADPTFAPPFRLTTENP